MVQRRGEEQAAAGGLNRCASGQVVLDDRPRPKRTSAEQRRNTFLTLLAAGTAIGEPA